MKFSGIMVLVTLFMTTHLSAQQDDLAVERETLCGDGTDTCLRVVDIIAVNRDQFRISINSAAERAAVQQDNAKVFFDSLYNYAANTQAHGVISGGFIRHLNPLSPLGGLRVKGVMISKPSTGWVDSAVICVKDGVLSFTRDLSDFESNLDCLQSGPVIKEQGKSDAALKADIRQRWPEDFWDRQTRRVLAVQLFDGSAAFLIAHNHSYSEVQKALSDMIIAGQRVKTAVGLNGGSWSGYVIRTRSVPQVLGDLDFVFPSVFLIYPRAP